MGLSLGLDIGSVSADLVVVNDAGEVLHSRYVRTRGRPVEVALAELEAARDAWPEAESLAVTGSGAKLIARLLEVPFVNELVAQSTGALHVHPEARTVIEVGGTESKLIVIRPDDTGHPRVDDFAMNALCAAGTGSFLDQQATRLGVSIEEFGRLALRSEHPPRVAGRCSVFAKSDMIHLQQQGTPDYDIIAGLCDAMAHNFRNSVGMGKTFQPPVVFQGGVAANVGMVRAFRRVLGLDGDQFVVPEQSAFTGAIGAVLHVREGGADGAQGTLRSLEPLREYLAKPAAEADRLAPLVDDGYAINVACTPPSPDAEPVDAYVGVDVGSISTNVVVLDAEHRVLARRYLMTEGRPLKAVCRGLYEVGLEVAGRVRVRGCATTGSGRQLTGAFIGADLVKNEISTHARAAVAADPRVDTVFEIGGQDAKYMSIADGAVVDFCMNKVCAAGTGSFLEEQAERLGLRIEEEFGAAALRSPAPCRLGERCTVFMESDLTHHLQRGVPRDDLVAGLCYSIVLNYLNRVVEDRRVGDVVFFQGGVAFNRGVKAAFEALTGKTVSVPPHHDILGAIGAAIFAHEADVAESGFRGFDLREVRYELDSFECKGCANRCEIHRVSIEGRPPLHYGSRCGRYDDGRAARAHAGADLPDLFAERAAWLEDGPAEPAAPIGVRIGMPRAMNFHDLHPLWAAFFRDLGCELVLSEPTNRQTVQVGTSAMTAETCLPIGVAHGHVAELLEADVDYVFVPSVVNLVHEAPGTSHSYACPLAQGLPYLLRTSFGLSDEAAAEGPPAGRPRLLAPIVELERGRKEVDARLRELARRVGAPEARIGPAIEAAWAAQQTFRRRCRERGRDVLEALGPDQPAVVVFSRPYNGCDPGMNLGVPGSLRALGALPIPLDFLPLDLAWVGREFPNMYWKYGQKILAGAHYVAGHPHLNAVYLSSFRCGPDAFITKFFDRVLGKPYLTLELDQHSSDVGTRTRLEAFADSLGSIRPGRSREAHGEELFFSVRGEDRPLRIYIPHMSDHGELIAAALRARGIEGEALPMSDAESVELGRRYTTGKECYPCVLTTGDFLKKTREPDFDPERACFFMAEACGPCRFGQYSRFHRMVLDEIGLQQARMVTLSQSNGFAREIRSFGPGFYRTCWAMILVVDYLQKIVRERRPRERRPGETDHVYRLCMQDLADVVEDGGDWRAVAAEARRRLEAVPIREDGRMPVVGLVGEIYVRNNAFANNFVVRKLEDLGAQVVMPTFQEWVDYVNYARRVDARRDHRWLRLIREWLINAGSRYEQRRISRIFDGAVRHMPHETSTDHVLELGSRYLDPSVRGEAILSLGRAVEYAMHGLHGVVNVTPFGCMPGALVDGLLEGFRRDYGLPVLKMAYDGTDSATEDTLLEAFVHQARQRMTAHGAPAAAAVAST